MRKVTALIAVALLISTSVWAKPEWAGQQKGKKDSEASATERVGDEIADSMADILTGEGDEPAKPKKGNMPPGLSKKDKTPPGWEKGKKVGWGEKEEKSKDSPIRQFLKNIFRGHQPKDQ